MAPMPRSFSIISPTIEARKYDSGTWAGNAGRMNPSFNRLTFGSWPAEYVAIVELKKAKEMFPEYAQSDGPYALLARAYEMKGDKRAATAENIVTYDQDIAAWVADFGDEGEML